MKEKRKLLLTSVVVILVLALAAIGIRYLYENTYFIATNNAQLTSDFIKVTPLTSGKLLEFNVEQGDYLVKDQVMGRLDGGAGAIIRAPISGIVVYKNAHIGEYESNTLSPILALIMDPHKIYVTANIDETVLAKIKLQQPVDITIDQFKGKKFTGKVNSIEQAMDQSSSTSEKVVKRSKVKIEFNNIDSKLLPGTNVIIKIHIK